ncbi:MULTISPECIES: hypothetical protein [unclassified Sulfuricurvum]|uniref:hypothetical protein n=1 Tax=unclassified Sulfuricurvum TaxID=2632390 RepID=UPI0002997D0A|nr:MULTISPECIES: hypothetical protein [unclassified Sulfuricurvum]AFV97417.1 hypothetical protein B649_05515 [Candidatus Sulfuricurvum sp. RIFRC-1]HBM35113.1 hypothetical protein [Sulfuricurvum sp.]
MKHIILLILLTLGVWAQEVGVPFVLESISTIDNHKTVLSRNGRHLYSLDEFGKFKVWYLYPFKKINEFHIENATNFVLSTDEKSLIITTVQEDINHNGYPIKSDMNLILWDIEKKQKQKTVKFTTPINDIVLDPPPISYHKRYVRRMGCL